MVSCIMATAEHPLEGSQSYCKRCKDFFPAFWMSMAEWDRWTENLKSWPSQIVSAAERKWQYKWKTLNSGPVTSNNGSEQGSISRTTAEKGRKVVQTFTGRPWKSQLLRLFGKFSSVCLPSLQLPKSSAPFGLLTMHDSVCNTDLTGFL